MTVPGTAKAYFTGTHRVRHPAETWELVAPLMGDFDVTRVADVTGLDVIGIPVWMAVRPLAATLAVSQGKGATDIHAKVSALMEAIELWHAESALPAVTLTAAAAELDLPYDVLDLAQYPGSLLTGRTRLDWVAGSGLVSGASVPVPMDAVSVAYPLGERWRQTGIAISSNGLASGNCAEEAALHALYEVIERDALAWLPQTGLAGCTAVMPDQVPASCASLVGSVLGAGAYLEIRWVPSRFGIPCFASRIWSPDLPLLALGSGAHSSAEVALSRAITESAQSRLTMIAGSRDDLPSLYEVIRAAVVAAPVPPHPQVRWSELPLRELPRFDSVADELRWLAGEVLRVTGCEPLVLDLSTRDEFAVAKVVAPGLGMSDD